MFKNMYLVKPQTRFEQLDPNCFFSNDKKIGFNELLRYGFPEQNLINWATNNFKNPDKDFIDIGANMGSWTLTLAPHFKNTHAFECNKDTFYYLCANICLRGLSSKVDVHQMGLGSKTGSQTFYHRGMDGGGDGFELLGDTIDIKPEDRETISICKLDDFNLTNVGFIKIDVEGFELDVLKGATKTLEDNDYPSFIFESWRETREEGGRPAIRLRKELFEYIESINYKIVPLNGYDEIFIANYIRT